jgi:hypothetical protein
MKVAALRRGFSSGVYRRAGDEFECPASDFVASWMLDLDKPGVKKPVIDPTKLEPLEIPSLMDKVRKPKADKKLRLNKEKVVKD